MRTAYFGITPGRNRDPQCLFADRLILYEVVRKPELARNIGLHVKCPAFPFENVTHSERFDGHLLLAQIAIGRRRPRNLGRKILRIRLGLPVFADFLIDVESEMLKVTWPFRAFPLSNIGEAANHDCCCREHPQHLR